MRAPLGAVALLLSPATSGGQTTGVPFLLLDHTLTARPVWVTGFSGDSVSYTTSGGILRTESMTEFAAMVSTARAAPASPAPRLHLADGQCFPGQPHPAPEGAESVRWRSTLFGTLNLPLDDVRKIALLPNPPLRPAAGGDAVVLANGDALSGFLESFGDKVRFDAAGSVLEIDPANIRAIYLDNPPTRPSGPVVWLADGTVAVAAGLRSRRDASVTVELADQRPSGDATLNPVGPRSTDVPLADVHAIAFDGRRLAPLASIAPTAQAAEGERRWLPPLAVGDPDSALLHAAPVELPGPMSATWTLPPRSVRFGALASLPDWCRVWGDCELVITASTAGGESVELLRRRFNAESPTAEIAIPLPGGPQPIRLTLTLLPGEFGAVQDRLVLDRALVLLALPER